MTRGKRSLESEEEQQPERKRPALASVIVEALKVDSLQRLCSSLEPILRRVVSEEVERALAKLGPPRLNGSFSDVLTADFLVHNAPTISSPKRIEGPEGRNLQLHFRSRLSLPLFTGGKVEGEQGAAIHVVLLDADTGHVVTFGPESSVKLDVVVLEGDFNTEDDEGWTQEEFESHVVKEREGKRPLLTGDLQVTLKEGVGTLGELTFTDNSSWIRSRKFRLGLKVASGYFEGVRIREAKTDAFTVKDHRGELYKKHYPPALNDDVWRLEKIGKDGSFHKRLNKEGIFTVEDFLRVWVRDAQRLRNILGSGMSNKMWEALMEHAKTCGLSGKHYVFFTDDTRNVGVVFNNIYELRGLITGEQYHSVDSLSDSQKVFVDTLVKKAYENWNSVIEYDGNALLSFKQSKRPGASRNELSIGPHNYSGHALDNQVMMPHQAVQAPIEQNLDSGLSVAGFNDNLANRYSTQPQLLNSNPRFQLESSSVGQHDPLVGSSHQTQIPRSDNRVGLALGPPQSSVSGFQTTSQPANNLTQYDDWSQVRDKGVEDFFSEEEIRLRSNEMLENEDMQQLLRVFSMGVHGPMNAPEDGYNFPSFMSSPALNYGYDESSSRPGKAVVGWLKIKAAMRWGFFVRKKAAERRAQLIELDEE
ncbi:Calmodulin binding protein-like, N-terminal domain [Dillenia turbinata]|uniref:Calmodulin binding protein-like, N-terminal domain n=1 Tax=Dillenia turbinata TaxID=194707 RepID=A0AAN8W1F2_9MAGN